MKTETKKIASTKVWLSPQELRLGKRMAGDDGTSLGALFRRLLAEEKRRREGVKGGAA